MSWITSEEMRKRERSSVEGLKAAINPSTGYGLFRRNPEGENYGLTTTYNLQQEGYPDLVISGTIDTNAQYHRWLLQNIMTHLTSEVHIDPKDDYVNIINRYFADNGMSNSHQAVKLDTAQWLMGYGITAKRFYGDYPWEHMCFIQIVEVSDTGFMPTASTRTQTLFQTKPFGQKEIPHAPVLPESPISCLPNGTGQGPAA